ncbi:mannose-1-phosphate guanylyltransferase 1-like [Magnolia sinica]|uniref:mannose-1-phosphate guanylyltransferase 1-like n=1 Tax=Magnolia sinica TaxID=86752 RepID=UPI002659E5D0|nr:mannose-1-phosphate guanylyltransferase 1-like [Magnolia sinica]
MVISNDETRLVEDMKKGYLQSFVMPKHNATIYLFNLSILETPIVIFLNSLEDVLRDLVKKQERYSIVADATWIDFKAKIGNVIIKKLGGIEEHPYKVVNDVLIDKTATIGADCYIGPCVVIGLNYVVENNVRLKNCMLMNGVTIKPAPFVKDSIIGSGSVVGRTARIGHACLNELPSVLLKTFLLLRLDYLNRTHRKRWDDPCHRIGVIQFKRKIFQLVD